VRYVPSSAAYQYEKAYATNATNGSFAARADSVTEPSAGSGVIDLRPSTKLPVVPTWVSILVYGTGDANDTMNVRVYGIKQIASLSWTHVPLLEVVATLGTKTGVAAGGVLDTELYADTLVAASTSFGSADNSFRIISPADNSAARILLDTEGFQYLRIDFDMDTGAPTGGNALVGRV